MRNRPFRRWPKRPRARYLLSTCLASFCLLLLVSFLHSSRSPNTPFLASPSRPPFLTVEYLRNRYFSPDAAREVTNENPVCVLPREYATMPWHTTDVRRATKEYLRRHTHVIVITGSYDNYTRVKAALCTWMGHVPSDALLLVTDHLPPEMQQRQRHQQHVGTPIRHQFSTTPAVDPVLRIGKWRAWDSEVPDTRLEAYYKKKATMTAKWSHPRGWFMAQLRFFDALQYAYDIQYPGLVSEDMQYKRWVMILDDDTYVHLDSLVASLQRHSVSQLLESNDYWWHILLRRTVFVSNSYRNQPHRDREAASRKAWKQRCAEMMSADATTLTAFQRAARRTTTYEECMAMPERMVEAVLPVVLQSDGLLCTLARSHRSSESFRKVVAHLSHVFSNLIFLLDDEGYETQASVWWQMWNEMDSLISLPWVQAFAVAPTMIPRITRAGQGNYFNAPFFYNRFFRVDLANVTERDAVSKALEVGPSGIPNRHYALHTICVEQHFFRDFCASDECFRESLRDIGGKGTHDARFTEWMAKRLYNEGVLFRHLGRLNDTEFQRATALSSTMLAELARDDVYRWTTGHVKMEFFDAMRDMSGNERGKLHLTPTQIADLQRLAHFRLRLYYDVIYLGNNESLPVLLYLGAQAQAEYLETPQDLAHVRNVIDRLFLPAMARLGVYPQDRRYVL